MAAFLLAERGRFSGAGAAAGLALLTRSAGIALLPALVLLAWRTPDRKRALAGVAVGAAALRALPAVLAVWIGRPLAFLDAQKVVWERRLSPAGPLGGVVAAVEHHELLDLARCDRPDRPRDPRLASHRGRVRALRARRASLMPLSFVSDKMPLWSMQRFAVVVFPAFMALATIVRADAPTLLTATILGAWLAVYVVRWALWYWVA